MAHISTITTQLLTLQPEKRSNVINRQLFVKVLWEFSVDLGDNRAVAVTVFVFIVVDLGKASL